MRNLGPEFHELFVGHDENKFRGSSQFDSTLLLLITEITGAPGNQGTFSSERQRTEDEPNQ